VTLRFALVNAAASVLLGVGAIARTAPVLVINPHDTVGPTQVVAAMHAGPEHRVSVDGVYPDNMTVSMDGMRNMASAPAPGAGTCPVVVTGDMSKLATSTVAGGGFGIMGDSGADEYRADDGRGGAYAATTFNWMELLARYRGLDFGRWGSREEPRRTGYEYNWARTGAVTADVIAGGQADGLAAQVAAGNVSTVVLVIGANDFAIWNGTYAAVYNGTVAGNALSAKVNGILANMRLAVEKIQAAGATTMFIATLVDRGTMPSFQAVFPDAAKRQRVTGAIVAINTGIRQIGADRGVNVVDVFSYGSTLLELVDSNGVLHLGGEPISLAEPGDEPHHMVLGDNDHGGTVASGLLANFFISSFTAAGLAVTPFTDQEILNNAGIFPSVPDSDAPSVSISSPLKNAVVSGTLAVTASASDNVRVEGVRFRVDGVNLGAEDTTPPYSVTWVTTTVANGAHTVTATARDAAGNAATATAIVTVSNSSKVHYPGNYSISQGTYGSGSVAAVAADDNSYLAVKGTTSGLTRYATTTFDFQGVARTATILDFTVIAKSSSSSTTVRISAYDFATGVWKQLSSSTIGTTESAKTQSITTNAGAYVDASGKVRLMIQGSKWFSSYTVSYELVRLTAR
jgi:lysophospholipase L1-like esterase